VATDSSILSEDNARISLPFQLRGDLKKMPVPKSGFSTSLKMVAIQLT